MKGKFPLYTATQFPLPLDSSIDFTFGEIGIPFFFFYFTSIACSESMFDCFFVICFSLISISSNCWLDAGCLKQILSWQQTKAFLSETLRMDYIRSDAIRLIYYSTTGCNVYKKYRNYLNIDIVYVVRTPL